MKRIYPTLVILLVCFITIQSIPAEDSLALADKKVLFTYGGWPGHQPLKCVELLLPWLQSEGAIVDTSSTLDVFADSLYMANIDLVIQIHTLSEITKEQENGLLRAVINGTGMAGWHGGMCDAFRQNTKYQFMTGGQWVAHPGGTIKEYTVEIIDTLDPITKGLSDFRMDSTEQYYMHVDPNMKVLAKTTFTSEHIEWVEGCTMPVVWKKYYGKGRIFYTSCGHSAKDLKIYEINTMLKRGIIWSAAGKYQPKEEWVNPVY